jgi:hypothetical protein
MEPAPAPLDPPTPRPVALWWWFFLWAGPLGLFALLAIIAPAVPNLGNDVGPVAVSIIAILWLTTRALLIWKLDSPIWCNILLVLCIAVLVELPCAGIMLLFAAAASLGNLGGSG